MADLFPETFLEKALAAQPGTPEHDRNLWLAGDSGCLRAVYYKAVFDFSELRFGAAKDGFTTVAQATDMDALQENGRNLAEAARGYLESLEKINPGRS